MFALRSFLAIWSTAAGLGLAALPVIGQIPVVATTAMIGDLVRQVGTDRVAVQVLMGPGVDPHLYRPSPGDVVRLQRAAAVFHNGLRLEGRMSELFERVARAGRVVHAVADAVPADRLLHPDGPEAPADPHLWLDVSLWAATVPGIRDALTRADPAGREHYARGAAATIARLEALHGWAQARAAELPAEDRVLVTSHDAFNYFGRAYGFRVVALQGLSTATEAGLADMAKLADLVRRDGVRAIFLESSVPPQALQRIARDTGVRIGGELFSDAMGSPGEVVDGHDLGTYEGMIRHNLNTIVAALRRAP